MRDEHINHDFLDPVIAGTTVDHYYHFGLASNDPLIDQLGEVQAIILAGSGGRIGRMAAAWSAAHGGAPVVALPKEDRFVTRYCAGVLFASHGMGMPSASIAVQELMRLAYRLKQGDPGELDRIFWARVGTSGGVGLPGGTVVVSTEGVMADLAPYRLLNGGYGEYWFDGHFPAGIAADIVAAAQGSGIEVVSGRTVATNEFFLEQFRLDGAICMENPQTKMAWLSWLHANGVRNIEMEGAMLAGYLNHWGFSRFAMICSTLLDRLSGDQVDATPEQLKAYEDNAGTVLFRYLQATLG